MAETCANEIDGEVCGRALTTPLRRAEARCMEHRMNRAAPRARAARCGECGVSLRAERTKAAGLCRKHLAPRCRGDDCEEITLSKHGWCVRCYVKPARLTRAEIREAVRLANERRLPPGAGHPGADRADNVDNED